MGNYDFSLDLNTVNTMSVLIGWIGNNSKILEFGPASGRLTKYLKEEKNCAVTIVEMDESSGKIAAQYAKRAYLGKEEGNIENFYWAKDPSLYDYIVFADVLEHLSDPKHVLEESRKHLNHAGKILISIPNISHNSIIIDLCKDEFNYDDTGLLDKTHIHFFTYQSFKKLITAIGMKIADQSFIYSRVGNNEIENSYFDLPVEVTNYLRKRPEGSIYQYVFCLNSIMEISETCLPDTRVAYEEDYKETLESKIYFQNPDFGYSEENKESILYPFNRLTCLRFDIGGRRTGPYIRWDPMEYSMFTKLVRYQANYIDGSHEIMLIESHNAAHNWLNCFLFFTTDPQIIFKLNEYKEVSSIELEYEIISYRFEDDPERTQQYERLLKNASAELHSQYSCIQKDQVSADEIKKLIAEQQNGLNLLYENLILDNKNIKKSVSRNEKQLARLRINLKKRKKN